MENRTRTYDIDYERFAKRRIQDLPKLCALRNAGWTIRKIAGEFGVTESEVKRSLKLEGMV